MWRRGDAYQKTAWPLSLMTLGIKFYKMELREHLNLIIIIIIIAPSQIFFFTIFFEVQSQFENCLQRVQCKTHVHIRSHTFILIRTKLTLQSCLADALLFTGSFSPSLRLWPSFNTFLRSLSGSSLFSWDSTVSQSKFAAASVHSVGLCLYVFDRVTVFSEFFCFALACLCACIYFLLVLYFPAGFFWLPLFFFSCFSLRLFFFLPPESALHLKGHLKAQLWIFSVLKAGRGQIWVKSGVVKFYVWGVEACVAAT